MHWNFIFVGFCGSRCNGCSISIGFCGSRRTISPTVRLEAIVQGFVFFGFCGSRSIIAIFWISKVANEGTMGGLGRQLGFVRPSTRTRWAA